MEGLERALRPAAVARTTAVSVTAYQQHRPGLCNNLKTAATGTTISHLQQAPPVIRHCTQNKESIYCAHLIFLCRTSCSTASTTCTAAAATSRRASSHTLSSSSSRAAALARAAALPPVDPVQLAAARLPVSAGEGDSSSRASASLSL